MVWLALARLFSEIAILLIRHARSRDYVTEEAYKVILRLLKDACVRIRNAQEAHDSKSNN